MNYQDVFNAAQQANIEQTLMLDALEMTSVIIAVVAAVAIIVTIAGIIHLVRSETKQASHRPAIRPRTTASVPARRKQSNPHGVRTQYHARRVAAAR